MKRRIVVADDDPQIVTLVSLRLGEEEYDVIGAPSGEDALKLIRSQETHGAILDVQMPGAGGLAALAQIKTDPAIAAVPVMMLTGERNPNMVMKALGGGAADYMVKPFNPDALAERVDRMIRRAQSGGEPWEL